MRAFKNFETPDKIFLFLYIIFLIFVGLFIYGIAIEVRDSSIKLSLLEIFVIVMIPALIIWALLSMFRDTVPFMYRKFPKLYNKHSPENYLRLDSGILLVCMAFALQRLSYFYFGNSILSMVTNAFFLGYGVMFAIYIIVVRFKLW